MAINLPDLLDTFVGPAFLFDDHSPEGEITLAARRVMGDFLNPPPPCPSITIDSNGAEGPHRIALSILNPSITHITEDEMDGFMHLLDDQSSFAEFAGETTPPMSHPIAQATTISSPKVQKPSHAKKRSKAKAMPIGFKKQKTASSKPREYQDGTSLSRVSEAILERPCLENIDNERDPKGAPTTVDDPTRVCKTSRPVLKSHLSKRAKRLARHKAYYQKNKEQIAQKRASMKAQREPKPLKKG